MSGIVFFSPHPDDVEFVLGGTVLLHCNRYATKIVVMTDGGAADRPCERYHHGRADHNVHHYLQF